MAKLNSTSEQKYHVPALDKAFEIIETLAYTSLPLSLTELSNKLHRSSSELFRILVALEEHGYIDKDENTGSYSLSLKLYELAHSHAPMVKLLEAAQLPMERLTRTLFESCHLSVLKYRKLMVLKEVLSPELVRLSVAVGGLFSPVHTSSGRLLLAQLSDDELNAFLEHSDDYASLDRTQRRAFTRTIAEIRETGISTAENENHIGVRDAAVVVGNPKIGLTAALAVSWLTAVAKPNHGDLIIKQLKQTAQEITTAMGLVSE